MAHVLQIWTDPVQNGPGREMGDGLGSSQTGPGHSQPRPGFLAVTTLYVESSDNGSGDFTSFVQQVLLLYPESAAVLNVEIEFSQKFPTKLKYYKLESREFICLKIQNLFFSFLRWVGNFDPCFFPAILSHEIKM